MLPDSGYIPTWVHKAKKAFAQLGADASGFEAVLFDVVITGRDGVTIARALREPFRALPILLASGNSHVVAQEGAHDFNCCRSLSR